MKKPTFSERVATERRRLDAEARRLHGSWESWQPSESEQERAERERRRREIHERRLQRQQKATDVLGYAATIAGAMRIRPERWEYTDTDRRRSRHVIRGWGIAATRWVVGHKKDWEFDTSGDSRHLVDVPVYGPRHTVLTRGGSIAYIAGTDLLELYERPGQITGFEQPEDVFHMPYTEQYDPPSTRPDELDILESQLVCFAAKNRLNPRLFE